MILVFGGGGQLAQQLANDAPARDVRLCALSKADANIADPASISVALSHYRPGLVVNAAAYTKVDLAEDDYSSALSANGEGPGVLAAACHTRGVPLVHISTDYVFDGEKASAYVESDPISPLGAYGRSKAIGEEAVRQRAEKYIVLRTAWVYGKYGANFLRTIIRLAQERDELRIVADQRGCPTSTHGLANAIFRVADRLQAGQEDWGTYHFTDEGQTTWHGFATHIVGAQARFSNRRPAVKPIPTSEYLTKAKRPKNSVLNCEKFRKTFAFTPETWQSESSVAVDALFAGQVTHA